MSTLETFNSSLMQILKVLAGSADTQIECLRNIGGASVDELGLEFEEVWLLADSILEANEISDYQYDAIKKLNDKLELLSEEGGEIAWTEDALSKNAEWEMVRELAKDCIKSFSDD